MNIQDRLMKIDALESCVEMFDCYGDFEKQINEIFDSIDSLEQQNTALQARINQLEDVNKNYGNTIVELRNKVKQIEKEYQEFGG